MRCYFHLVGASSTIPDPEGIEVGNTEQLPAVLAEIIREIENEDGTSAADWSGWRLNVTTGDGTVLASIALDALPSMGSTRSRRFGSCAGVGAPARRPCRRTADRD